ncbi:ABC transporter substrate-binding protein [Faecalicatena sp. AGMB00832]|uniref:ABC transporter substrate-binding protein n=1 Tax=Faecalicatena faecalis TaxID=2726362 RepID=A0ABS6D4S3_9FIRM|nr:ABC transporter substrate-binding protein [Faecalicatena faecalis]MBU3876222.1 ABC transporter substrate-binding protein [Faecalicatena faecalis]
MKKRLLCVLLTAAMAMTLAAGCGNSGGGEKKSEKKTTSSSSETSDTLIFAQGADPRSLDPAFADDGESTKINTNIYEGLVQYAAKTTEIEPCLAESWDISEDGLTYTFHLREGVKFHDGTDFNAEAVKYNFDRQLPGKATEDMPYAGFVFAPVKDVVADDEYTVTIHLNEAQTPFLANLAMIQGSPIVSPKALEENNGNVTKSPCGTGPYKFVSWDTEQSVILERNDEYWGEPAKMKNVIFKIIKDNSARVIALNNGEADIIDGIDATVVDQIKEAGNTVQTDEAMMTNYMAFNTTDGAFKDKEARRAICAAINVPEMVETLYQGYDVPATTFLPTSLPGYDESIKPAEYDPEAAKAKLGELGVTNIHIITYSNPRPYNTVGGQKLAEAVQGYLSKVGVECTIDAYDWTTFKTIAQGGDFDLMFAGWGGDNGDPDNFMNLLATDDPSMNYSHFHSDKYNELIAKGVITPVGEERSAIYTECEKIIADEAPILPISHANFMCGVAKNVDGFFYHVACGTKLAGVTKK